MSQPPLEEPIDVDALMADIRRRAREALAAGVEGDAHDNIQFAQDNSRLELERPPAAPGRIFGRVRNALRRWLYRETRLTLDPALEKQTAWNTHVAAAVLRLEAELDQMRARLEALEKGETPPEDLDWTDMSEGESDDTEGGNPAPDAPSEEPFDEPAPDA